MDAIDGPRHQCIQSLSVLRPEQFQIPYCWHLVWVGLAAIQFGQQLPSFVPKVFRELGMGSCQQCQPRPFSRMWCESPERHCHSFHAVPDWAFWVLVRETQSPGMIGAPLEQIIEHFPDSLHLIWCVPLNFCKECLGGRIQV